MSEIITPTLAEKLDKFKRILEDTGGCAVAYSGGVDSTLVIAVAHEVLGDRSLAVTATSSTYPRREFERAIKWLEESNVPHVVIHSEELDIPEFSGNPRNRCYYCKKELFEKVGEVARDHGLRSVADGSNADDTRDYRPGMAAAGELGVLSPLKEAGLTKEEIRILSREVYHLPTADKPSMACLASRFPYGSSITRDKLNQVETIEEFLEQRGFRTYRARHHGDILRLELGPHEMSLLANPELRGEIARCAKDQGFTYVTVDIEGYRTGSMNEAPESPRTDDLPR